MMPNKPVEKSAPDASSSPAPIQPAIENGFVRLPAGEWLGAVSQPAACKGSATAAGLRGWLVPDRGSLRRITAGGECWFSTQKQPFLTRLDAMPDKELHVVSSKVLVSALETRSGSRGLKLIPMSLRRNLLCTDFKGGWVIAATASRVTRVAVAENETLTVRPESVVAWFGPLPTGFCPKLSILDLLLPRNPSCLAFSFHGPSIVWFEGTTVPSPVQRSGNRVFFG